MYHEMVVEHSLYVIDESTLHKFKELANEFEMLVNLNENFSLNARDNWPVVLNIWLMFQEAEKKYSLNYSKMMIHACNFYCLDLLRKTKDLNYFFDKYGKTEGNVLLLSYYLGRELLIWTANLLSKSEEGKELMAKNFERDYFLLAEDPSLVNDETHQHYEDQKLMTSLLAQSHATENDYKTHISTAIRQTKSHLQQIKISK